MLWSFCERACEAIHAPAWLPLMGKQERTQTVLCVRVILLYACSSQHIGPAWKHSCISGRTLHVCQPTSPACNGGALAVAISLLVLAALVSCFSVPQQH